MPDIDVKTVMAVDGDIPTRVAGVLDNITRAALGADLAVLRSSHLVDAATYGGGSVDSVAHIQAKIDAAGAAGGGIVYFPKGDYKLTATTTASGVTWHLSIVDDNVWLEFAPGARLVSTVSSAAALFVTGAGKPAGAASWATYEVLDATYKQLDDAAIGAVAVTCSTAADATTFAAGDFVYIRTGQTLAAGVTEPDAEINQVVAVSGGTGVVTLRWPLAKPYAQEYFIAGTSGTTSTAVTANAAVFGIAKVTDRIISNIKIRGMGLDLSGGEHAIIGGQIADYEISGCTGVVTAGGIMSQGMYRRALIANNRIHARGAGALTYAFTTATGTADVLVEGNIFTGERVIFAHIHEGSANVTMRDNVLTSTPSTDNESVVSVRVRAYNIRITGNTIVNGGDTVAVYVDGSCTGGGEISGNTIRGTNFGAAITVDVGATGWRVGPNDLEVGAATTYPAGVIGPEPPVQAKMAIGFRYTTPGTRDFLVPTLNTLYAVPLWVPDILASELGHRVSALATAGGVARVGIYLDNGVGQPGALLTGSTSTLDTTTPLGGVWATLSSLPVAAGLVWLAAAYQVAAPTVSAIVGANQHPVSTYAGDPQIANAGYLQTGVSGALPSTWGTVTDASVPLAPTLWLTRNA